MGFIKEAAQPIAIVKLDDLTHQVVMFVVVTVLLSKIMLLTRFVQEISMW
jgi:hypothetical protein